MAYIQKKDTDGTKATLLKGELGYDDYTAGGDTGRVYVGNGTENIPLAKLSEVGGVGEYIDTSIAISSDGSALANDDGSNNNNIGIGYKSLNATTSGSYNTSIAFNSLAFNTTGIRNTAVGAESSYFNTTGSYNTSLGNYSLFNNTTGAYNTAIGHYALLGNAASKLTGSYNTGVGYQSGSNLTTGQYNVLNGYKAGYSLTTGSEAIFIGSSSGLNAATGSNNIAIGRFALAGSSSGDVGAGGNNVVIGNYAGGGATSTLTQCTILGSQAGTSASMSGTNVTCLGYDSEPSATAVSNEITLGNSSIATLRCQVTTITALSDRRDKDNIVELDTGLNFINALRPVRFDWNMRDGGKVGVNDIGFIAQELQQAQADNNVVVPHLVMDENPDKLEAGYGMLIAPLVKAIQELSSKVDDLTNELNTLKGL